MMSEEIAVKMCLNCGHLGYRAWYEWLWEDYIYDEEGRIKMVDSYVGDWVEYECSECGNDLIIDLILSRNAYRELYNSSNRIKTLLKLMLENRVSGFDVKYVIRMLLDLHPPEEGDEEYRELFKKVCSKYDLEVV